MAVRQSRGNKNTGKFGKIKWTNTVVPEALFDPNHQNYRSTEFTVQPDSCFAMLTSRSCMQKFECGFVSKASAAEASSKKARYTDNLLSSYQRISHLDLYELCQVH